MILGLRVNILSLIFSLKKENKNPLTPRSSLTLSHFYCSSCGKISSKLLSIVFSTCVCPINPIQCDFRHRHSAGPAPVHVSNNLLLQTQWPCMGLRGIGALPPFFFMETLPSLPSFLVLLMPHCSSLFCWTYFLIPNIKYWGTLNSSLSVCSYLISGLHKASVPW